MFFIAYTFKGQVHVFAGRVKIVSHWSCRTSAILKYVALQICPFISSYTHKKVHCYGPKTPGRVAQSVTCLATDACLTADPGVASLIPARSHTFVEIDHEIISTVILLLPLNHS